MFVLVWQGRGVGNGKKKMEAAAAAMEERDKPYACDSESHLVFCQRVGGRMECLKLVVRVRERLLPVTFM